MTVQNGRSISYVLVKINISLVVLKKHLVNELQKLMSDLRKYDFSFGQKDLDKPDFKSLTKRFCPR